MTSLDTIDTIAAAIAGDTWAAMDERDRHGVRQAARRQIERVARAIFASVWPEAEDRFHPAFEGDRAIWESAAVAAILAMPEPAIDEAMK